MRVKVSRTVDLSEIPTLVERIVAECREALKKNVSDAEVKMYDVPNMIQSFEETIEDLDLTSAKLQDVINISIGWQQAVRTAELSEEKPVGDIGE